MEFQYFFKFSVENTITVWGLFKYTQGKGRKGKEKVSTRNLYQNKCSFTTSYTQQELDETTKWHYDQKDDIIVFF